MTTAAVLICTSGRSGLLKRALAAIAEGSRKPDQLVIVNGSDGETPDVVARQAAAFDAVVLVEHPNRNLATLRNLGMPFCSGEIVAMTDDDAIPNEQWLQAAVESHEKRPAAGGIGGPVTGVADTFVSRLSDMVVFPRPRPGQPLTTLPTVNMSYKRPVMEAVGNFDESLFRGEDVDYNWRVNQGGHPLAYEPAMQVRHEHRASLMGLFRQQYMYGRAYVLVRRKWPAMYCVYPHSLRSARSWVKLAYAGVAILYEPLKQARLMERPRDKWKAYPVLVAHHLVWKLGMIRQAVVSTALSPGVKEEPTVTRWVGGKVAGS